MRHCLFFGFSGVDSGVTSELDAGFFFLLLSFPFLASQQHIQLPACSCYLATHLFPKPQNRCLCGWYGRSSQSESSAADPAPCHIHSNLQDQALWSTAAGLSLSRTKRCAGINQELPEGRGPNASAKKQDDFTERLTEGGENYGRNLTRGPPVFCKVQKYVHHSKLSGLNR